jgi:hypothetical protein
VALPVSEGSLVSCRFPYKETPYTPGEPRPALVLERAVDKDDQKQLWLLVGYASGQGGTAGNSPLLEWKIEIDPSTSTRSRLTCPTVISLDRTVWLRLDDEWFEQKADGYPTGRITRDEFSRAYEKFKQVSALQASTQPPVDPARQIGPVSLPPATYSSKPAQPTIIIKKKRPLLRPTHPPDTPKD